MLPLLVPSSSSIWGSDVGGVADTISGDGSPWQANIESKLKTNKPTTVLLKKHEQNITNLLHHEYQTQQTQEDSVGRVGMWAATDMPRRAKSDSQCG
jgi:hypothetical protein